MAFAKPSTNAANTAVDLDAWLDATNPTLGAYWTLSGWNSARDINNDGLADVFFHCQYGCE